MFYRCVILLLWAAVALYPAAGGIPECILNYQYGPEQYILVVEKNSQTLFVYSNYKAQPVEQFRITTGKSIGPKRVEGDKKTPEGIYFFRQVLTGSALPKTDDYGDKAFTLNYPNPIDNLQGRNGSGIWLHGAHDKNKTASPNNTRGCVVLDNVDLSRISRYILLNQTPICIYETIRYDTPENIQARRERFLAGLQRWQQSWENKDMERYVDSFAASYFLKGMSREQFRRHKENLNRAYRYIRVRIGGLRLYAYGDVFVTHFNQLYVSDKNSMHSRKFQYWQEQSARMRILWEETAPLPATERFELESGRFVTVSALRLEGAGKAAAPAPVTPSPVPVTPPPAAPSLQTRSITPSALVLEKVDLRARSVVLNLNHGASPAPGRFIPVLLYKTREGTVYQSLGNIPLKDGVPADYSGARALRNGRNTVELERRTDAELRSLTIFLVGGDNQVKQILTYMIGG